ncbi:hypothetical protein M0802_005578 [Mischocyttarus mexicanus]|nr:hypothetical protein M0802_005578 [Mischocyttarus mexicanus]
MVDGTANKKADRSCFVWPRDRSAFGMVLGVVVCGHRCAATDVLRPPTCGHAVLHYVPPFQTYRNPDPFVWTRLTSAGHTSVIHTCATTTQQHATTTT